MRPQSYSTVSWLQLEDRVAVTFQNLPEHARSNSQNYQIEMFFDGTLRITYGQIDALDGLAGLSAGNGVPETFFLSDIAAYESCGDSAY